MNIIFGILFLVALAVLWGAYKDWHEGLDSLDMKLTEQDINECLFWPKEEKEE